MDSRNEGSALWGALLALPIAVYFFGMPNSLVGSDGDEFLLQAFQRGVGHLGSSPAYVWIGSFFMLLTGDALYTMHLLSAVFMSASLILLWLLTRELGASYEAATFSTLMFAFTPVIWRFGMRAERYSVNAFFIVGLIWLLKRWSDNRSLNRLIPAALLFGLSLGIYLPNILMLVPMLALVFLESRADRSAARSILTLLLCAVCGAAGPLLYSFWRAQSLPPIGTAVIPGTLRDFLFASTAEGRATQLPDLSFIIDRLKYHAALLALSFAGLGIYGALLGWETLKARRKSFAIFLSLIFCFNFGFFTIYSSEAHYNKATASYIIVALFLAVGIDSLPSRGWRRVSSRFAFLALIAFQIALFPSRYSPTGFPIYKRKPTELGMARRVMKALPTDALLFSSWHMFPTLLCAQHILKERPELEIYEGSLQPRHYRKGGKILTVDALPYIDAAIKENRRPIYYLQPHQKVRAYFAERYAIEELPDRLISIRPRSAAP